MSETSEDQSQPSNSTKPRNLGYAVLWKDNDEDWNLPTLEEAEELKKEILEASNDVTVEIVKMVVL
jgi:hypothetical protein